MRRGHVRGFTGPAANASRAEITVFGQDPHGRAQLAGIQSEGARIQGLNGGHVYLGDKGAPERSWNGPLRTPQAFVGAARMAAAASSGRGVYREQQGRDISTGVADEGPFADPSMRIFAQRLARRSPM